VVATGDPFPRVAGAGIARLRAAGITVEVADDDLATAARDVNIGFFSRVLRQRPWVRLKAAASLDGVTALPNGQSQWITGAPARADGHAWRRRAGAVLSGIGTVLADDPRLDVRLVPTALQPLRVVVDSRLRLPNSARLLDPPGRVLVATAIGDVAAAAALAARGVEVVALPGHGGQVDLATLLAGLAERGINELHVEAGATLNGALFEAGLVDELLLYVAPRLLGSGRPIARIGPLQRLEASVDLHFTESRMVGDDLRLRARLQDPQAWIGAEAVA
jgi:diaminohydroxyphosphoribosylaminopyrimidine deaminase / 5-amino-6-(5-phosphoribosylamino)uracil reductase